MPIDVHPDVLRKALEDLDIDAPVYQAYITDDTLVIQTREGTDTLPLATGSKAELQDDNADTTGSGLDDLTAIDGVGPVTAEKLHDAGLHTYDDLREWPQLVHDTVGLDKAARIRDWLAQRLV